MNKLVLIASTTFIAASVPMLASARDAVPDENRIEFDVFRGNSDFGTHVLTFEENGDELRVTSDVDLRAGIGPITVFRYRHDAVEVYRNGVLVSIESETLKDGENLRVDLDNSGGQLIGRGTNADGEVLSISHASILTPSSHWRGYSDDLSIILNTETGEEMPVTITEIGTEMIEVGGHSIEARHIRLEGSLTLDLWYGPDGDWVKCQFSARGENITYIRRNL